VDVDGAFSQNYPGFLIMDLFFITSQAMFYFFTEPHNKNHHDQINPRNESHTSNNIHMDILRKKY